MFLFNLMWNSSLAIHKFHESYFASVFSKKCFQVDYYKLQMVYSNIEITILWFSHRNCQSEWATVLNISCSSHNLYGCFIFTDGYIFAKILPWLKLICCIFIQFYLRAVPLFPFFVKLVFVEREVVMELLGCMSPIFCTLEGRSFRPCCNCCL